MAAFFNSLHFNCIDGKQVETPIPAFPQGGEQNLTRPVAPFGEMPRSGRGGFKLSTIVYNFC
jgi:hypothetical protein